MSNNASGNTINNVINELKRLQVEHGDLSVIVYDCREEADSHIAAWPTYNEKENRVEF